MGGVFLGGVGFLLMFLDDVSYYVWDLIFLFSESPLLNLMMTNFGFFFLYYFLISIYLIFLFLFDLTYVKSFMYLGLVSWIIYFWEFGFFYFLSTELIDQGFVLLVNNFFLLNFNWLFFFMFLFLNLFFLFSLKCLTCWNSFQSSFIIFNIIRLVFFLFGVFGNFYLIFLIGFEFLYFLYIVHLYVFKRMGFGKKFD